MKSNDEVLKKHIRRIVREILVEISTSDGAGAFLTKGAFRGNREANIKRQKKTAELVGYKLTARGKEEANRKADITEAIEQLKATAAKSLREIRGQ